VRLVIGAAIAGYLALAASSVMARSPMREARAQRYFSASEIERGRQFSRERRLVYWVAQGAQLGLLLALLISGSAAALAARAMAGGGRSGLPALFVGGGVFLAQELVGLPFSIYGGFSHLRRWGLTDRSFASWLIDHLKALGVQAVIGALLLLALYGAMRLWPRTWWLAAGLGSGALSIVFAFLAPVLLSPLFNSFTPLSATRWAAFQPRILELAEKADLPVREVLVMDASRQGRHTNAYFTGFGGTRRIVLYDTLLTSHTEDEALSILGHEMGHWRHQHIVKGIALGTLGALLGFFVLKVLLTRASQARLFAIAAPDDPAGWPLILLLAALGGFASAPVSNGISRGFEREADADALALFGHPQVFVEAERRLARDNIGNVAPADLNVLLFATHPPVLDRIAAAERWAEGTR
jgi:STE24 endopeptidase